VIAPRRAESWRPPIEAANHIASLHAGIRHHDVYELTEPISTPPDPTKRIVP